MGRVQIGNPCQSMPVPLYYRGSKQHRLEDRQAEPFIKRREEESPRTSNQ